MQLTGGAQRIDTRLRRARELSRSDPAAAAREYVWLWRNMLKYSPSHVGVRASFMVANMRRLSDAYPQARAVVSRLRDRYTSIVRDGDCAEAVFLDWITLERRFDDGARIVRWLDRVDRSDADVRRLIAAADEELFEILLARGDLGRAGELLLDPVGYVEERALVCDRIAETHAENPGLPSAERARAELMRDVARLVAALRAAGREDAARDVELRLRSPGLGD